MDTGLDFFNAWAKAQKDFLETSLKSNEVFRTQWLDSMKKTQDAFVNVAGSHDNPQGKEIAKLFNAWFGTMIRSSELFNDEVLKIQKSWEKALEIQLDQGQEMLKSFSEFLKQTSQKPADTP